MRMRNLSMAAAVAAAAAATFLSAGAAMSAPAPHVTGSVALDSPDQYVSLNNIGGPASGSVSYTNFTYPDPGSGGWSLPKDSPVEIDFGFGGGNYPHHLTVDSIDPTGLNSFTFIGHGSFDPDQSYTWNATGSVSGNQLRMHIVYTGTQAGYYLDFTGTINPDGSVTGTQFSDSLGRTLTVSMPAGSLFEALSYAASASNVSITEPSASWTITIPAGHALAGTIVNMRVYDGGSPGTKDTIGWNGGSYPIDGGNLTVH